MTTKLDQDALDALDDFESDDLADVEDADDAYLNDMWSRHSFRSTGDAMKDALVAHGMVQSFVNAFARDGHYVVAFDDSVSTAGTDMDARKVVITPAPIADRDLTPEQAGLILTGLAVHEICHPRYGKSTADAVRKVFPSNPIADRLSNLLDDIRIERRFVADYPGYAGVFTPTLEYVGKGSVARNGGKPLTQRVTAQVNLAIAATRYPTFSAWTPETSVEAAWWNAWADRWSREDAPRKHVEAIREALAHIVDVKAKANYTPKPAPTSQPAPTPKASEDAKPQESAADTDGDPTPGDSGDEPADDDTQSTEGEGAGTGVASDEDIEREAQGGSGAASDDETDDEPGASAGMDDQALNDATADDADEKYGDQAAACSGSESVEQAARDNGTDRRDITELRRDGDAAIEAARNMEGDGHGNMVDVAKSLKGLTHGGPKRGPSDIASRHIRNAILRSRTGNTEVATHQKRGRLDGHGLARVAFGDSRIFEKRVAPSPGKFRIWVMVDASSSMDDQLPYAAQVAHAMATATHGTPTVNLSVWAWSDPFRPSPTDVGVVKVWETGRPVEDIFRMSGLKTGWTPDATVMGWAARAIKRAVIGDEKPVIIFVSDGAGDVEMTARVAEARAMGVDVYSVSFGSGMREAQQLERFGKGNYVPFAGSIVATAKPLANLFARIVGFSR